MNTSDRVTTYGLLLLIAIGWVLACADPSARRNNEAVGGAAGSVPTWTYLNAPDDMGKGNVRSAAIKSDNTVNFDFPYRGEQHATLSLRTHPRYGKDVIISVDRGQFLCGVSGCSVDVRFDDGKPIRYVATEPADHSTTTLFISNHDKFLASMKRAQRVQVAATFYQQGTPVFNFRVADYKAENYEAEKGK